MWYNILVSNKYYLANPCSSKCGSATISQLDGRDVTKVSSHREGHSHTKEVSNRDCANAVSKTIFVEDMRVRRKKRLSE